MGTIDKNTGELRSTFDVLQDLSKAWENLTSVEKQELTEVVAGKTQRSLFTAIMTNFDTAVGATEAALDSEGSATEENRKRMESLQGRLTQLDTAWQKFAKNTIDSTVIKSLLSLGTNLLKFADTDSGRVILAITAMTVAWKAWQKVAQTDTIIALGNTIKKSLITAITATTISFNAGTISGGVFGGMLAVVKTGVDALTASMAANPLFWGGLAVAAILAGANAWEKYNEKQREAQAEIASTNKEQAEELKELEATYTSLSDKTDKTEEDYNTLKDTIDTLADKYKIEREELEGSTEARQKAIDKINEEISAKRQAAAQAQTASVDFKGGEQEALEGGTGTSYNSNVVRSFSDIWYKLTKNVSQADEVFEATGDRVVDVQKKMEEYISTQSKKTDLTDNESSTLKKVTQDYTDLTSKISTWKEGYQQALNNLADGIPITEGQANAMYSLGMITKEQLDTWRDGGQVVVDTTEKQQQQTEIINNLTSAQKNYNDALSANIETLANYSSQMDMLTTAQDELSSSGALTVDTFKNLQDNGLLQYLELVNGQLTINTDAFENSATAAKQQAVANLQASAATQIQAIMVNDLNGKYKDMDSNAIVAATSTASTSNTAGEAAGNYKTLADSLNYGAASYENFYNAQAGQTANAPQYQEFSDQAKQAINTVIAQTEAATKAIESLSLGSSSKSSKSSKSSGATSKSTQSEYKATIDTLYKYSNAVDIAKNRVSNLNKELSNTDNLEEQEKITRQLIDALNNQIQKTNELKDAQTRQINDYINQLRQQGFAIDYNNQTNELYINNMEHLADFSGDTAKNLEKLIKNIQSLNSDNVSLDSSIRDLTNNTKKYYDQLADYPEKKLKQFKELMEDFQQSQLDQVQNQIDDIQHAMEQDPQLKALKEQLEAMEAQTDEKDKQAELEEKMLAVEKAREALENAKRQKTLQVYREGIGWTWETDPDEVANAQQDLIDAEKDLEDTRIDQAKEALEKQIEDLENSYQDQIDKLQDFLDEQNYQIDKANRSAVQSFEELAAAMKKYGIDSAENLSKAKEWLDSYNKSLMDAKNNASTLAKSGNGVLYSSDIQGYSMPGISSSISGVSLSGVKFTPTGETNNSNIYIDKIDLPNVSNANEFVEALKTLPTLATAQATSRKK